jgi:hypothetical protein
MTAGSVTRVRPAIWWILGVVLVGLVAYVGWSAWDYREARHLERAIDATRQRGSFGRDFAPVSEYGDDAARYYLAAAALVPNRPAMVDLWRALWDQSAPVPPDQLAASRAILDESMPVFTLTDRAFGAAVHPWYLESQRNGLYRLQQLLSFRTAVLAREGRGEEAARTLVQEVDLARAYDQLVAGTVIPWRLSRSTVLSRTASALALVLNAGPLAAETLGELAVAFEADAPDEVARVLAWQIQTVVAAQPTKNGVGGLDRLLRPVRRARLSREIEYRLTILDGIAEDPGTWPARLERVAHLAAKEPPPSSIPYQTAIVTMDDAAAAAAVVRTARAALAVERFRIANGHLAETLGQLVPTWLDEVPLDPFDGEPLRFRSDTSSFTVYSVGRNRTDDGGTIGHFGLGNEGTERFSPDIGLLVTIR